MQLQPDKILDKVDQRRRRKDGKRSGKVAYVCFLLGPLLSSEKGSMILPGRSGEDMELEPLLTTGIVLKAN